MKLTNEVFIKLCRSIEFHTAEWDADHFRLFHKQAQIQIWVANGWDSLSFNSPADMDCFSFFQKLIFWHRFKRLIRQKQKKEEERKIQAITDAISKLEEF